VEYWKAAWDIITDPPDVPFSNDNLRLIRPIIGYGPETFMVTMQQTYPGDAQDRVPLFFKLSRPHNHYLYLATTIGVLGLTAFLAILAMFFYMSFRHVFMARDELDKLLLIAALASMTGFLADCLFNPETLTGNLVFWLSLSIVPALIKLARAQSNHHDVDDREITKNHSVSGSDRTRRRLAPFFVLLLMAIAVGITVRPFLADVYFQRGLNLNVRGSPEAVRVLEKAVKLQTSETTYLSTVGLYYYRSARLTSDESQKTKYLELSTQYYQQAKEAEPLVAYHYHILADVHSYRAVQGDAEKWSEALSLYEQASKLFPGNVLILNKWVLALIASGDLNEAREKLQRAVDIDPSWIGNLMCGLIIMERGDDSVQEIVYNMDVNKMNPRDPFYFVPLCRYIYASGLLPEFDSGVESYSEHVPNVWLPHAMLAVTSVLTADSDRGFEEFKTAIQLAPDKNIPYLKLVIQNLSRLDPRLQTLLHDEAFKAP
jgi:tetratricopeptide (TPR) repeat protein